MGPPITSNFSSQPFLLIGPKGSSFYVHGHMLAKVSKVLAVQVNGPCSEAQTKTIKIEAIDHDLDDESLARFVEFVYHENYTTPPPDNRGFFDTPACTTKRYHHSASVPLDLHLSDMSNSEDDSDAASTTEYKALRSAKKDLLSFGFREETKKEDSYEVWGWSDTQARKVKKVVRLLTKDNLWSSFCDKASAKDAKAQNHVLGNGQHEDYARVLICHARLYVFSNRYQCESLRDLCLQKLRFTLSTFTVYYERLIDIIKLIRYAYSHTPDFETEIDKLRSLVIEYIACKVEELCEEVEFLRTFDRCNGLARDLMVQLLPRLR